MHVLYILMYLTDFGQKTQHSVREQESFFWDWEWGRIENPLPCHPLPKSNLQISAGEAVMQLQELIAAAYPLN